MGANDESMYRQRHRNIMFTIRQFKVNQCGSGGVPDSPLPLSGSEFLSSSIATVSQSKALPNHLSRKNCVVSVFLSLSLFRRNLVLQTDRQITSMLNLYTGQWFDVSKHLHTTLDKPIKQCILSNIAQNKFSKPLASNMNNYNVGTLFTCVLVLFTSSLGYLWPATPMCDIFCLVSYCLQNSWQHKFRAPLYYHDGLCANWNIKFLISCLIIISWRIIT